MASQVPARLRFAPSPTGFLHVGGARTALFNWLLARKLGGAFVLRIEDTDAQRSTDESLRGILDGMRWLGLHWDEGPEVDGPYGPYQQTLRQVLYHAEADRLLRQGHAYRCFCTRADLDEMREAAHRNGLPVRYDQRCRRRDPLESTRLVDAGQAAVVRLRMPDEGEVVWMDLVRGEFRFKHAVLDDFVLLKSDGNPTYNFAVVVDDAKMRISHVIRGDDHISNTPRQLVLFDALGFARPEFAHLPMIVGADRTRLSKRHGATSVTAYRDLGVLSSAMVNYLALLGWSPGGEREVFDLQELVTHFDLKNTSRTPAVFDLQKLLWMNHEHFGRLSLGAKLEVLLPQMRRHGLWPPRFHVDLGPARHFRVVTGGHEDKVAASIQPVPEEEWLQREPSLAEELPRLERVLEALGNRLGGPHDVPLLDYFYSDDFGYEPEAVEKHLSSDTAAAHLEALAVEIEGLATWSVEAIEAALRGLAERLGTKAGTLIHPARVALTGHGVSPGLFEVIYLLGRAKSVERLRRGADIVRHDRELPRPPAPPPAAAAPEVELAGGDWDDRPPSDDA
jgi:glutamyl-tRNA synthetase